MLSNLPRAVIQPFIVIRTVLTIGLIRIASSLPFLQDMIKKYNERHFLVPYENFWPSWCSWDMLTTTLNIELSDLKKTARVGLAAPNCNLVSTEGQKCRVLDFMKGNRPLVLNFGSCTWPPFFIRLQNDFTKVVQDFGDVADFLVIYIREAHPSDGWSWNVSNSGFFFVLSSVIVVNNLNIIKMIFFDSSPVLSDWVAEIVLQTFYNGVKKITISTTVRFWACYCLAKLLPQTDSALPTACYRERDEPSPFCVAIWRQKAKNHLKDLFIL